MANRATPPMERLGELAVLHLWRRSEALSGAEFAAFVAAREAQIAEAGWTVVGVACCDEANGSTVQLECRSGEASEEPPIRITFTLVPPGQ